MNLDKTAFLITGSTPIAREMVRVLPELGYEMRTFPTIEEMSKIPTQRPDLVVCDASLKDQVKAIFPDVECSMIDAIRSKARVATKASFSPSP